MNYEGEGTITIGGCALVSCYKFIIYKYAEGSTVFWCQAASGKGKLEKIVIKSVRLVQNRYTYGQIMPLYIDTWNALWNEWELCDEATAISLAEEYFEKQAEWASKLPCRQ